MTEPIMLRSGATYYYWRVEKYGDEARIWYLHPVAQTWSEVPGQDVREVFDWMIDQAPEGRSQWRHVGINVGEPIDITKSHDTEDYVDVTAQFELTGHDWDTAD